MLKMVAWHPRRTICVCVFGPIWGPQAGPGPALGRPGPGPGRPGPGSGRLGPGRPGLGPARACFFCFAVFFDTEYENDFTSSTRSAAKFRAEPYPAHILEIFLDPIREGPGFWAIFVPDIAQQLPKGAHGGDA